MKKAVSVLVAVMMLGLTVTAGPLVVTGKANENGNEVRVGLRVLGDPQPEHAAMKIDDDEPFYKKVGFWILAGVVAAIVVVGENNDWGSSSGDNRDNDSLSNSDSNSSDNRSFDLKLKGVEVGDDLSLNIYNFSNAEVSEEE